MPTVCSMLLVLHVTGFKLFTLRELTQAYLEHLARYVLDVQSLMTLTLVIRFVADIDPSFAILKRLRFILTFSSCS